ncbi:hypothetical protein ASF24_09375 [Methylobacterium sp. Leaf86]|nr:hypothetical protein ASF24_09375 [Methylobacterium sp. Leaf86]
MRSAARFRPKGLTISASLLRADAEDQRIDHCHVIADVGYPGGGRLLGFMKQTHQGDGDCNLLRWPNDLEIM